MRWQEPLSAALIGSVLATAGCGSEAAQEPMPPGMVLAPGPTTPVMNGMAGVVAPPITPVSMGSGGAPSAGSGGIPAPAGTGGTPSAVADAGAMKPMLDPATTI